MTELKKIYDKIYTEHLGRDPKQLIRFYEQNKDLIEVEDLSLSNPDYNGIMRIMTDYAKALSYYGNSKKALIYLNKSDELFKNSTSAKELVDVSVYEDLIWVRGTEYFNQKKYSLAIKDFQYLVDNYPNNDKYRDWLLGLKTTRIKKYTNFIWPLFFVCIIWSSLLDEKNRTLILILLYVGAVLFVLGIGIELFNFLLKKKIKRT